MTDESQKISRRDFMKVSARCGMTSTLLAAGTLGAGATLSQLAHAAEATEKKRRMVEPKFELKFGASGFNDKNLDIQKSGQLFFAKDLEDRTNGAIRVEFIGSNQICGQTNCVKKTQQGIVDIYSASTQNSAGGAPYLNALDYAYMFPTRASQFHFFYSPQERGPAALAAAQAAQAAVPVHPLRTARHSARAEVAGQANGDLGRATGRREEPGDRHPAGSDRHGADESEPGTDRLGGDPRRSKAGTTEHSSP